MDESQEKIPKKKNVFLIVLLSIITVNIYNYAWYIKRTNELNNLRTISKFNKSIPIISLTLYIGLIALCIVLLIFTPQTSIGVPAVDWKDLPTEFIINISLIIIVSLILTVMYLLMAFKTRKILNESEANKGEKVKLSWFFTLIFNSFYLQYEINRIIDDKENNKRKGPWAVFIVILLLIIIVSILMLTVFDTFISL